MVLLPAARTGSRDSHEGARRSIDVRVDTAGSSPAKARMLWREGFTQHEIENSSINDKEVKRQEVIFEIIHTEADYVRDLRIAVRVLQGPLRELRIVSGEQAELMFGNIGEILELHEDINAAFMERQRVQYPVVWDISDVLLPFVARFRVYARYICNQDNALRLVEELRRTSRDFGVFWKERQQRPECRALPMEAFLALPFQRLLKYPLLLRTLLGATEGWSQQFANGSAVAEQVDAWINKIQDARTKLDSFACIDALSRAVPGVDWAPLVRAEHKLTHAGAVRTTSPHGAENGGALPPDRAATMWLFDDFAVIAASAGAAPEKPSCIPAAGSKFSLVLGPCQIVEVLELAQCKGAPAAYLHAVPFGATHAQKSSIVVRFASRADYTLWRGKLDAHVRHVLSSQPALSADVLAEAIARAQIVESGPAPQCIGAARSPPSTGRPSLSASAMASSSDIPTINVRDVYVQFPAPRHKGRLRRGWDFLCSKTEDMTGNGIKRQLRKYGGSGGGGGKRRGVEESPPVKIHRRTSHHKPRGSPLARAKPASLISTPLMGPPAQPSPAHFSQAHFSQAHFSQAHFSQAQFSPAQFSPAQFSPAQFSPALPSPSFVHISKAAAPTAVNGGRESAAHTVSAAAAAISPPMRLRSSFATGTYHPRQREARASTVSMANSLASRLEQPYALSSSLADGTGQRALGAYPSRRSEDTTIEGMPMQHDMLLSSMEFGSAARACAGEPPLSSSTSLTGRTIAAAPRSATYGGPNDDEMSDSEFSTSEISALFPEHMAERSGSTLFSPSQNSMLFSPTQNSMMFSPQSNPPQSPRHTISYSHLQQPQQSQMPPPSRRASALPKPLPVPPTTRAPRKPAPVFEIGSAKLTYGVGAQKPQLGLKTWGTSAKHAMNIPKFQADAWNSTRQPARSWQAVDADNPSSANSTDSFCIVNREPQPPVVQIRRQSVERQRRSQTFT